METCFEVHASNTPGETVPAAAFASSTTDVAAPSADADPPPLPEAARLQVRGPEELVDQRSRDPGVRCNLPPGVRQTDGPQMTKDCRRTLSMLVFDAQLQCKKQIGARMGICQ